MKRLQSADLDFLLTVDDKILSRYISSLTPGAQAQFRERLSHWREKGPVPNDVAALKMYRAGVERLIKAPPAPPTTSYAQKQFNAAEVEAIIVEDARENIETFIEYVTDKKPARHHLIWLANIFHPDRPYVNLCAPPGAAKTHYITAVLAFILGKYPLLTNSIISVSDAQAQARLGDIKFMVEYNERYHNVFPHIKIDVNRTNSMSAFSVWDDRMSYPQWVTLLQREGHPRDPSLFAAGSGNTGIIGRRWSGYCMIDDMVDQTMLTEPLMKAAFQFVAVTLLSRLVPGKGRAVNIGTRWMSMDLIERLQKNSAWHTVTIPAIWYDDDSNPHSYWPEYWTLDLLEKKRLSMREDEGSDMLFELMYLNNPQASAAALFTPQQLDVDLPGDYMSKLVDVFITTDWALKVKEKNDFTVFLAVGVDADGGYYLLDMLRLKMGLESSPAALGNFANEVAEDYGLTDILIEDVAFQSAIGILFERDFPYLPYTNVKPVGDKGFRASLVSDVARAEKLFINQRISQLDVLKKEWLHFGTAKHDDTLDPMGLLIQYLGKTRAGATMEIFTSQFLL